ncbi:MAG: hypothetical protein GXP30_03740 [Verrucomicrobia bacterium]|nr:hypothetical protein [Verrucomicrobiota bacterium]
MNKSFLSFGLVLLAFALTTMRGHAQLTFTFEQQGTNTVVTGSGTATTGAGGVGLII